MQNLPAIFGALPAEQRPAFVRRIAPHDIRLLNAAFPEWAHPGQLPPPGDWRTWVIMAGRGFGKTRAGAEWVLSALRHGLSAGSIPAQDERIGDAGTRNSMSPNAGFHSGTPYSVSPLRGRGGAAGTPDRVSPNAASVRIALIAATIAEARRVMVEGPSGLLACARAGEIVAWQPGEGLLRFKSGAEARLYSGASPEGLRGPEHDFAWCDELAKWRHPQAAWDMLQLGLRRGVRPRALITTTPRAGAALEAILALPDTVRTGGASGENRYLPRAFLDAIERDYAGTRLGRQEVEGELLSDVEGSLWPLGLIEASRSCEVSVGDTLSSVPIAECGDACRPELREGTPNRVPPVSPNVVAGEFARIVIGVDPPASAAGTCGIVVCGVSTSLDMNGNAIAYVLADASVSGASPETWARAVASAAERWNADRVIAEANQGGDMVASVLAAAAPNLPLRLERAHVSKGARAEPVAALFERGRAKFAGVFRELEAELTGMTAAGGYHGPGASPDRADAMVWALWALMLQPKRAEPRIRVL